MSYSDEQFSAEHIYSRRAEGAVLRARLLMLFGYLLFAVAYFLFCYISRFIPLFAICPILLWILVFFTWPLVGYEVYCEVAHAELTIGRAKKRGKRHSLYTVKVKEITEISRLAPGRVKFEKGKVTDLSSSRSALYRLAVSFRAEGKERTVVFDTTAHLTRLLINYYGKTDELSALLKELQGK